MSRFFARLWAWIRDLFDLDGRPPPRGSRETDGLPRTDEPPRYIKSESVLTFPERRLYLALLQAVGDRYQILAKVRLGDIVYLDKQPTNSKYHRNQTICKHVDFLLCQPGTLAPLLVIELDDSSHAHPDNRARDEFKNNLFDAVGLPWLRLEIQSGYSTRFLREQIEGKLIDEGEPYGPDAWAE